MGSMGPDTVAQPTVGYPLVGEHRFYDPIDHVNAMKQRPDLRLFVVSDRNDKIVSYRSQLVFVDWVKAHNLPITHVTATATDEDSHGLSDHGLRIALNCASPEREADVVLYEQDAAEPQGKRYVGSAIWRTETISPGPGRSPELAVRADIEIPERKISVTWSLRRNTDQNLPASHTVEVMFKLPADFSSGSISNVPGILMKQSEQTRGVQLAGLAVKVTSGFFLIGLPTVENERERNIRLLKERSWFDIPVVYSNNRRAILAIEKGAPGERTFAEVFQAWGQ
jgi:hypothetical protein